MRRRHATLPNAVDTGVSVYGREDVRAVDFKVGLSGIIDDAISVFNFNTTHRHARRDPLELMLPIDIDPHEPVLQLAKVSIERYGPSFVASVDAAKASLSNRATDLAIDEVKALTKKRPIGFAFLVLQHSYNPPTEGLLEIMDKLNELDEPPAISSEDLHAPRIERLRESMGQLTVPTMSIVTLATPETMHIGGQQQTDSDPGLANLG